MHAYMTIFLEEEIFIKKRLEKNIKNVIHFSLILGYSALL